MKTKKELLVLTETEFKNFTNTLSTLNFLDLNPCDLHKIKEFVCADGCSGVPDWYVEACNFHDFQYRTHRNLDYTHCTKAEADRNFRLMIQKRSLAKLLSPMSWWRWAGVKWLGTRAWEDVEYINNETPKDAILHAQKILKG